MTTPPQAQQNPPPTNDAIIPTANVERFTPNRWLWLIPLAALIFVGALIVAYVVKTGPLITLRMAQGHGIKAGDLLRCRGINVGQIESVRLSEDLSGIVLRVRLETESQQIARAGSRFWVVRPQLDLSGVGGLETIAGPRYLAVLPGEGEPQKDFVALEQAPIVDRIDPNALEVTLVGPSRLGLHAGSPVLYRGVPIGVILAVSLSSDAASVEARAYIEPPYVALVRTNSHFWAVSGAGAHLGITGLSISIESIQTMLIGGVAMATPNTPGERPSTGHRFTLNAEPEDEWLEWSPPLAVGVSLLPPTAAVPDMLRAALRRPGFLWGTKQQSAGWLLVTTEGLLGPTDLVTYDDKDATLELAGRSYKLTDLAIENLGPLSRIKITVTDTKPFPMGRSRKPDQPEDILVVTGPGENPLPISASRLEPPPAADHADKTPQSDATGSSGPATAPARIAWAIDDAISFGATLHGAAVMARSDGALLGLLLLTEDGARIAALP